MKKEQRLELGRKFMVARSSKSLTQKQVALKLGIGQSHYQKIEAGDVVATMEQFLRLCIILSISLEDCTKIAIDVERLRNHNASQHIIVVNSEENFISMQKTFEAIIRRKDKIISTQRRQLNNLLKEAYGISV